MRILLLVIIFTVMLASLPSATLGELCNGYECTDGTCTQGGCQCSTASIARFNGYIYSSCSFDYADCNGVNGIESCVATKCNSSDDGVPRCHCRHQIGFSCDSNGVPCDGFACYYGGCQQDSNLQFSCVCFEGYSGADCNTVSVTTTVATTLEPAVCTDKHCLSCPGGTCETCKPGYILLDLPKKKKMCKNMHQP